MKNYTFVVGIVGWVDVKGNLYTREYLEDLEKQMNQKGCKTWWSGNFLWASVPIDRIKVKTEEAVEQEVCVSCQLKL